MTADRPGTIAGLRRYCAHARHAEGLADRFDGLGEGITRWRLAAALRTAAGQLGLSGPMLRLLEFYIDLTYDQDWEPGNEPVITRPLVEIAEHMGRSERQIRNIERALMERSLLAWRDSGNHHRKGWRDRRTGRLVSAFGPSLAPMGARAAEIIALAEATRREAAEKRRLRLRIGALKRRIRCMVAAASAEGQCCDDIAAALEPITKSPGAGVALGQLEAMAAILDSLCHSMESRLSDATADMMPDGRQPHAIAGKAETNDAQIPETEQEKKNVENGHGKGERDGGIERRKPLGASSTPIGPHLVMAAAGPVLRSLTDGEEQVDWHRLTDAARRMAPLIGIDGQTWGEACGVLGRPGAAAAVAILEHAVDRAVEPVRHPAAYLRAMMNRARLGTLHLDRSLRALATQQAAT